MTQKLAPEQQATNSQGGDCVRETGDEWKKDKGDEGSAHAPLKAVAPPAE